MESLISSPNYQIAVSLGGDFIFLKQKSNTLIMKNPITGEVICSLKMRNRQFFHSKKGGVRNVAKSINKAYLVFVYEDNTYSDWPTAQVFTGDDTDIPFIYRAVSQNGQWALRETKRGCSQIHNLRTGEITLSGYDVLPCIANQDKFFWQKILLSNDAQFIVRAKFDNDAFDQESDLVLTDLKSNKTIPIMLNYRIRSNDITSFVFSENCNFLMIGFSDGSIGCYRVKDSQQIFRSFVHNHPVTSIAHKKIDDNLALISGASNGDLSVFTKQTEQSIRFKLNNSLSMVGFAPDNQHIIVGEFIKGDEQCHIFEIKTPFKQDNLRTHKNLIQRKNLLPSLEDVKTCEVDKYYCLLYNVGTEDEGIHCLQNNGRELVLLFQSYANAVFFIQMIKDQGLPIPTPEQINEHDIKKFCNVAGYTWEIVPAGDNTLIHKELHFDLAPAEPFHQIGYICGPGLVLCKFYINKHLYYEKETYVKPSHLYFIGAMAPLYPETFTGEAQGYIMFFPDDRRTYYKLIITLNPLIKDKNIWDSYCNYNITFENLPSKEEFIYTRKTTTEFEAQLLRFLDFQECLLGNHHEQLIKTLDKLVEVYEFLDKNYETQTTLQRKLELQKLYEPKEIILSLNESKTLTYTLFGVSRANLQFLIILFKANIFAGYLFLVARTYITSESPFNSYIKLMISIDKIVDAQSISSSRSINQIDIASNLSLFHQLNEHFINFVESLSYLLEPDVNRLASLRRSWFFLILLISFLDIASDFKYFARQCKQIYVSSQIRKIFANPQMILKKALISIFLVFCITSLVTIKVHERLAVIKIPESFGYPFSLYFQFIGSFSITFLTLVIIGSFLITIIIFFTTSFIKTPLSYISDFIEKKYKYQQKWFIWLILLAFIILVFPTIAYLLIGISLCSIKFAEIAGLWFSKLAGKSYWLILIIVSFMASVGDVCQWMVTARQKKISYFITNIYNRLFNEALVKTFSGALVFSLLGSYLNQWFWLNFDTSDYFIVSVLSASGAYIGVSRERSYKSTVGCLIGAIFGVYLIKQYTVISMFNELILMFIGRTIGALVGGIIGFGSGAIIAILFCILTVYFLLGLYFLGDGVADQITYDGYQKMFGIMLFIITIIAGCCAGSFIGYFF